MRLWSVHPKYLDSKGMVALWREGLLAQKVLEGKTRGYRNHPQLTRFQKNRNPLTLIEIYLSHVFDEADARGYNFDRSKILVYPRRSTTKIAVSNRQVEYEFAHLLRKLQIRDAKRYRVVKDARRIEVHPLFTKVRGGVAPWEKR